MLLVGLKSRVRAISPSRRWGPVSCEPKRRRDAPDRRASALPFIKHITAPTLIVHSKDDPFIPFAPFERPEVATNPNVALLATDHGGHVGFVSANADGDKRFWAEVMLVEFVKLMAQRN